MKSPGSEKFKAKSRKRSKRRLWSRQKRPLMPREYLRLPTRETLTYAEAQKFVDVETNGEIHRLNICEPLEIIHEDIFEDKTEQSFPNTPTCPPAAPSLFIEDSCSLSSISKLPQPVIKIVDGVEMAKSVYRRQASYFRIIEKTSEELSEEIEYDMDEEDVAWLKCINDIRRKEKLVPLSADSFETAIDRLEKEAYLLTVAGGNEFKSPSVACDICLDSDIQSSNIILTCDVCSMAVHQDCYGIPFVPDGPWLCKKCMKSPNSPVACCLCPVKDGALKQTDDGRWVHVLCAFWIPEVGFGNAVYLEPVEKIDQVPDLRFQLKCEICNTQGTGACIRCQTPTCDSSFHATCAMKARLFMKMEPVPENGSRMNHRKTFFCNEHRPVEASLNQPFQSGTFMGSPPDDEASRSSLLSGSKPLNRSKAKKSKKPVADQPHSQQPVLPVPTIPQNRLLAISDHLNVRDRRQLIARVHYYWLLKRQSRNGYPLIQRLLSMLTTHHILRSGCHSEAGIDEDGLKFLKKLRQDLEKVRLLLELIRKREKLKSEQIKLHQLVTNLQLHPFAVLLRHTLNQLQTRDPAGVFAYPVPVEEVPDYLERIKHPMDFSTMLKKIESHVYQTMDDFEADFLLIIKNCLLYNAQGSVLHKIALKLREQGNVIIAAARRMSDRADYCLETGLHRHDEKETSQRTHDADNGHHSNTRQSAEGSSQEGLEGKLKELLKQLDVSQVVRSGGSAMLVKRLKKEIALCRRKLTIIRQDQETTDVQDDCSQASHTNINNSCLSSSSNMENHSKISPKQRLSPKGICISPQSSRQSLDERICRPTEVNTKGRTRRYTRNRLKSADSALEQSLTTLVAADRSVQATNLLVICDDGEVLNDRLHSGRSTRQDSSNSVGSKRPRLDSADESVSALSIKCSPRDSAKEGVSPNILVSHPLRFNGQSVSDSVVTTRSASRRLSLADGSFLKAAEDDVFKRQYSLPTNNQLRQRTCGRFHMIAQPVFVADSTENDSSYESSYSMLSDSELSKCNSPDSQAGGTLFTVVKKKSRSAPSVDAIDTKTPLHPRDVVWAKSRGYPWYPAMIIDPEVCLDSDLKVVPPSEVLALQPKCQEPVYLIRFFDKRHNWQWLPRNKLEPLGGLDSEFDAAKIAEIKQSKLRRDVRRAYDEATKTSGLVSSNRNSFIK